MLTTVDESLLDDSFACAKRDEARLRELYAASRRGVWTWQSVGACVGLAGGCVAPFAGALLLAADWAFGQACGPRSLHFFGSAILCSTIPLLLAGGHCLDLLERRMMRGGRPSTREVDRGDLEIAARWADARA